MISRNVMSLTLASLLLLAFASGRGEAMSSEKEEGGIVSKLFGCVCKEKEKVSTSIIQTPSNSPTIVNTASFESEPYKFDLKRPPKASNIQAFERIWIPHFLKEPDAIDPKGYYKLLLNSDDIQFMFQAPKRSEVSKNLQGSSASATREYIEFGGLEVSLRTTIDHEWKAIFEDHANKLYAVFVSGEFRDKTTSDVKGKIVAEKSGTVVKYAAFRWEKDGRFSAIKHPLVKENILTFSVSYREKNK